MKKTKSRAAKPADQRIARVCISTAEKIEHLAEQHNQPLAVIAGTLADIAIEMLNMDARARLAGTDWNRLLMQVIRKTFPKPKCIVPILTTEYVGEVSAMWTKDLSRPLDEWLGQMIEIGVLHYHKTKLLETLLPSAEDAFFLTVGASIREDNDCPEAAELLKPAPRVPAAFLAFEKSLAAKGGEA